MDHYKHSGGITASGLLVTIVAGTVVSMVLGVVYVFATTLIPLIYVNFLVTGVFAFGIGYTVAKTAAACKVRNTFFVGASGFVFGLLGLYTAWAAYPMALAFQEGEKGFWAFNPQLLWEFMKLVYEHGAWGITANTPVTGIMLGIIWLIEAAAVVGGAAVCALAFAVTKPFCERCNAWTKTKEGVSKLSVANTEEATLDRIFNGDLGALAEAVRASGSEKVYMRLDLATCPTCTESNYFAIEMITHTVDDEGKPTVENETLLPYMAITEAQIPMICEAGRELTDAELAEITAPPTAEELDFLKKKEDEGPKPEDFNFSQEKTR